jgi:hypothetical protein
MKITYHDLLDNPELLSRLQADARRERSRAVSRLLIAPIFSMLSHPFKASHAASTHLARQG